MIIGLTGPKGAGKSEVARKLFIGYGYQRLAFADPLKLMLKEGLGLTHAQLYGSDKEIVDERYGCTPRHMMQTLGTEWGRTLVHADIWASAWGTTVDTMRSKKIVADDVRHGNEAVRIRNRGGIIIRVYRETPEGDEHSSEDGWKSIDFDYLIINDGTIQDLSNRVRDIWNTAT